MTYVTGFFLVFAGMLIGYFLWYRDRTEEEQSQLAVEREANELRATLRTTQSSHSILEERFARQKGQLNVLQQLCDDWSTNREQSERDRVNLEMELDQKRKKHDEAAFELQRTQQKRIELEDQIHALTRQQFEKANQIQQEWQQKQVVLEAKLTQRQAELKSAVNENERLAKSLHHAEFKNAELSSEIEANRKMLETATKNAGGLKQEYVSLESSLKASSDLLKQARGECAATLSKKKVAEQALTELQLQHQETRLEADRLQAELTAMKSLAQDVVAMKQSLVANQEQLDKVTAQREQALKAEKTLIAMSAGLQSRLDNQESTIHNLREKHKDALEQAKRELQLRTELETNFDKQRAALEARFSEHQKQVELQSSEITSKYSHQTSELSRQVSKQSNEILELTKKREALLSELNRVKQDLSTTKTELAKQEQRTQFLNVEAAKLKAETLRIVELEKSLADRDSRLKQESELSVSTKQRVSELEKLLTERTGKLKQEIEQQLVQRKQVSELEKLLLDRTGKLQQEAEQQLVSKNRVSELEKQLVTRDAQAKELHRQFESLREQTVAVQARQSELQSRLDEQSATTAQFESTKRDQLAKSESLQSKLKSSEETIRQLRRERAGVLARLANYRTIAEPEATVISFKQAMQERQRPYYDQEYGGHTENHAVRGVVYMTAPENSDDLKRISGIAEVLEARLNDFGIYTFKQIMDWKPEAIAEFSRLLAFRDRIERDDWKGQARYFYEQKMQLQQQARSAA